MAINYIPPLQTVTATAQVQSRPQPTQPLNQACIIDQGDSNIALGQYVYIDSINEATTTYAVSPNSQLYLKLAAWFNLNKEFGVSVYQAGTAEVTTPASPASITSGTSIGTLLAFQGVTDGTLISSFNGQSVSIIGLNFSTAASLSAVLTILINALALAYPGIQFTGSVPGGTAFQITAQNYDTRIQTTVGFFTTASSGTDVSGAGFFDFITGDATLIQGVALTTSTASQITAYTNYLNTQGAPAGNTSGVPFMTLLPYDWGTTNLVGLLTSYNAVNLSVYFMIDFVGYSFISSPTYAAIQGYKSILCIENGAIAPNPNNAAYTFAYLMANYNQTSTVTSNVDVRLSLIPNALPDFTLTLPQQQALIAGGLNFFSGTASAALLQNGTSLGQVAISSSQTVTFPSWDLLFGIARVLAQETAAVQVAVNAGIKYNQIGIIKLAAVQKLELKALSRIGIVQPSLRNTITFIPYKTYAAANPADITAGVYNGFEGTALIAGYLVSLALRYTIVQQ